MDLLLQVLFHYRKRDPATVEEEVSEAVVLGSSDENEFVSVSVFVFVIGMYSKPLSIGMYCATRT